MILKKILLLLSFTLFIHIPAQANMPEPQPPPTNPHPPQTAEDKARVALAELAVKKLLMEEMKKVPSPLPKVKMDEQTLRLEITAECLEKNDVCLTEKQELPIALFQNRFGRVLEYRHAHIIPWSLENFLKKKPTTTEEKAPSSTDRDDSIISPSQMPIPKLASDEYMIHMYARFSKTGSWYHLDAILSEDAQGKIKFQRFFAIQMPYERDTLPDGVDCFLFIKRFFSGFHG